MTENAEIDIVPWIATGFGIVAIIGVLTLLPNERRVTSAPSLVIQPAAVPMGASLVTSSAAAAEPQVYKSIAKPARVFECMANNQRVFADAPCGEGARERTLREVNRMDATPQSPQVASYSSSGPGYGDQYATPYTPYASDNSIVCESLKELVSEIHERMRQLYSSQEGNDFRARLRKISDQQGKLSCER